MKFQDLGLAEPIVRAIAAEGYVTPTPIQIKAIPHVLAGSDLLGCAQTGTGKTGAFAMPILHRLGVNLTSHGSRAKAAQHRIRALVLCPTRELASQIAESFGAYGRQLPLRHLAIFGGVRQHHQVRALKSGVDILIATPGRLFDLMNQGFVDLRSVEVFVLDEADRMLDMGFVDDIRKIVRCLPQQRQTLLFSATMPAEIRGLANSITHRPVHVQVATAASTVQTVSQSVYFVSRRSKTALLRHLLKNRGMARTLVFTRTKHGADRVVRELQRSGIHAEAIHGNKSQNARTRALSSFKSSTPPVLVATDIASRGIDVDEITHVINFDMPNVPETYIHRIGRTARAGASGVAVSFCDYDERNDLKSIERLIRKQIDVNTDEPDYANERSPSPDERAGGSSSTSERGGRGHRGRPPSPGGTLQRSRAAHPLHNAEPGPVEHRGTKRRGRGRVGRGSAARRVRR